MNNDYLWDRTGEPDPEIQHLEQVLGTLRYQPQPLELPAQVLISHKRSFFPRMAIAAAVATMLVGGTTWLLMYRQKTSMIPGSASTISAVENVKTPENTAASAKDEVVAESKAVGAMKIKPKPSGVRKSLMATNKKFRPLELRGSKLTASDRAEAQAAKQQLLLALRVASAKLSLAQKKAQGGYPMGLIRNQHKVG